MTQPAQSATQMNAQTRARNPCVLIMEEAGHSENGSKVKDVEMHLPVASRSDAAHKLNSQLQGATQEMLRRMNPKVEAAIPRFLESSHNDTDASFEAQQVQQVETAIGEAVGLASDSTTNVSRFAEDATSALLHEFRMFLKRSEDNLEIMKEMKEHMVKLNEKQDAAYRLIQDIHAKVAAGRLLHNTPLFEDGSWLSDESLLSDDGEYLV